MILDDGFRLSGPNHHRVENLWPQYRDASHNRHHDDQRLSGPQRATGWLTVPAVGRCCHCDGSSFWNFRNRLRFSLLLSFLPFFIDSTPCGEEMPFASRSLVNAFLAKTFSFHLSMFERYRPHNRKRFDNFHSIFPFRAPLTEMTRLLLVGCFKCTQFNLSFRFTFLLQSRSSLRFGNQLLHNLRGMEKSCKLFFSFLFYILVTFLRLCT